MNNTIQSNGFFGKLKNTKKRYWVLAIVVVLMIPGIVTTILEGGGDSRTGTQTGAQAASPASHFEYRVADGGGIQITRYIGPGGAVVIPARIEGVQVTVVGGFDGNSTITSVVIPQGVHTINNGAFSHSSLSSITIPRGVHTIGGFAFSATQITSVNLPASIRLIGFGAFQDTPLTTVNIPSSVRSITFQRLHEIPPTAFRGTNLNVASQSRLREVRYPGSF